MNDALKQRACDSGAAAESYAFGECNMMQHGWLKALQTKGCKADKQRYNIRWSGHYTTATAT